MKVYILTDEDIHTIFFDLTFTTICNRPSLCFNPPCNGRSASIKRVCLIGRLHRKSHSM